MPEITDTTQRVSHLVCDKKQEREASAGLSIGKHPDLPESINEA